MWHGVLLNNASYLWFKAHVKHSIRLIQHQVAELKKTEVLAKLRNCKKAASHSQIQTVELNLIPSFIHHSPVFVHVLLAIV